MTRKCPLIVGHPSWCTADHIWRKSFWLMSRRPGVWGRGERQTSVNSRFQWRNDVGFLWTNSTKANVNNKTTMLSVTVELYERIECCTVRLHFLELLSWLRKWMWTYQLCYELTAEIVARDGIIFACQEPNILGELVSSQSEMKLILKLSIHFTSRTSSFSYAYFKDIVIGSICLHAHIFRILLPTPWRST